MSPMSEPKATDLVMSQQEEPKKESKVVPKGKKSKGKHEEIKREDTIGLGAPYYWEAK